MNRRVDLSVVITAHKEGPILYPTLASIKRAAKAATNRGYHVEIVVGLDSPDTATAKIVRQSRLIDRIVTVNFRDPSKTRNAAIAATQGRRIAIMDGDNLVSRDWFAAGLKKLDETKNSKLILHPDVELIFGRINVLRRNIPQSSAQFNELKLSYSNYWDLVAIAPREAFTQILYAPLRSAARIGFEDWHWNCETLAAGWSHEIVPRTVHFKREKETGSRNQDDITQSKIIGPSKLWSLAAAKPPKTFKNKDAFYEHMLWKLTFFKNSAWWKKEIKELHAFEPLLNELEKNLIFKAADITPHAQKEMHFFPKLYAAIASARAVYLVNDLSAETLAMIDKKDLIVVVGDKAIVAAPAIQKSRNIFNLSLMWSVFEIEEWVQIFCRVLMDFHKKKIFSISSNFGDLLRARYNVVFERQIKTIVPAVNPRNSITMLPSRSNDGYAVFLDGERRRARPVVSKHVKIDVLELRGVQLYLTGRIFFDNIEKAPGELRVFINDREVALLNTKQYEPGRLWFWGFCFIGEALKHASVSILSEMPNGELCVFAREICHNTINYESSNGRLGARAIRLADGKSLRLVRYDIEKMHCRFEIDFTAQDKTMFLNGWFVHTGKAIDPTELYIFDRSRRLRGHVRGGSPRPEVSAAFGGGFDLCGVQGSVNLTKLIPNTELQLCVVDLERGLAVEIPHGCLQFRAQNDNDGSQARLIKAKIDFGVVDARDRNRAWVVGDIETSLPISAISVGYPGARLSRVRTVIKQGNHSFFDAEIYSPSAFGIPRQATKSFPVALDFDLEVSGKRKKITKGNFPPAEFGLTIPTDERTIAKPDIGPIARLSLHEFLQGNDELNFMSRGRPLLSVVMVLYNRSEFSLRALQSLQANFSDNYELIVVDNASTDETRALLRKVRGAKIILNSENLHFIAGSNQGARVSRGRYLLFLNSDCEIFAQSIRKAIEAVESQPRVGVVGGKLLNPDISLQEAGFQVTESDSTPIGYGHNPELPEYCRRQEVGACSGAFLLTPRSLFLESGGFSAAYSPAYYEDADYCMRVRDKGFKVLFEPEAKALHHGRVSNESDFNYLKNLGTSRATFAERWRRKFAKLHSALKKEQFLLIVNDLVEDRAEFEAARRAWGLKNLIDHQITIFSFQKSALAWDEIYKIYPKETKIYKDGDLVPLTDLLHFQKNLFSRIHSSDRARARLRAIDPTFS